MIEYGRAKHFSKVTIHDHQTHLIWTSAHDDRHDEEWEKPIISTSALTQEIIDCRVNVPIITVRVKDTDIFGTAWYAHSESEIFAISIWHEDRWKDLISAGALQPPAVFVSVPRILGEENVRFILKDPKCDKAVKIP
jgi:hypothetical protein